MKKTKTKKFIDDDIEKILRNSTFNIIESREYSTDYGRVQRKITDRTRVRKIFAWRPWWIEKKFRWFKKIEIEERLEFVRYLEFDDGWSYTYFWKPWKEEWIAQKII